MLWDPVVHGDEYLETLDRMHAEMLAQRSDQMITSDLIGDELLGFPYPPARRQGIERLDLTRMQWNGVTTALVASQDRPEYRQLVEAAGPSLRYDIIEDAGAWDELSSSQATLLPTAIPAHIASIAGGPE